MTTNRVRPPKRRPNQQNARGSTPHSTTTWQQKLEHYLARAKASADAGDRIEAESCYQHADHYFRLIRGTVA